MINSVITDLRLIISSLSSKNHGRAMESLQASLDTEQRSKAEGLRIKKKLDVSDDITKEETTEDAQCKEIIKIIIQYRP